MQGQKFRVTFKCKCGSVFQVITKNPDKKVACCPDCKDKQEKIKFVRMGDGPISDATLIAEKLAEEFRKTPEFQQALLAKLMSPTPEASQNRIKAVDETAKIVMEDHKMTDLPDHGLRTGDVAAPKLPPKLQAQADGFFGGAKSKNGMAGLNTRAIAAAAMRGAYSPKATGAINPIAEQHRARLKPNVRIINESGKA
jgi:hypothetical protein